MNATCPHANHDQVCSNKCAPCLWRDWPIFLCRNDYLGLSTHASVKSAVLSAVTEHGMGPRASSLVAGHTQAQRDLELQVLPM